LAFGFFFSAFFLGLVLCGLLSGSYCRTLPYFPRGFSELGHPFFFSNSPPGQATRISKVAIPPPFDSPPREGSFFLRQSGPRLWSPDVFSSSAPLVILRVRSFWPFFYWARVLPYSLSTSGVFPLSVFVFFSACSFFQTPSFVLFFYPWEILGRTNTQKPKFLPEREVLLRPAPGCCHLYDDVVLFFPRLAFLGLARVLLGFFLR